MDTVVDAIQVDTQDIQGRLPAALVGGRIDATVDATGMEAGAANVIAEAVMPDSGVALTVAFKLVDVTDGYTPETGLSPTVTVSTDGGAFAAADDLSITEVGNGWYEFELSAAEMTGSRVIWHATGTGARPVGGIIYTTDAV